MSVLKEEEEFVSYVTEMMQAIGPVIAKRMFGGHGIFLDGLMFGLISDHVLYLKADKETEKDFNAKGLEAFKYYKKEKAYKLSYCQAPEETLEDSEEMKRWANKAYDAAIRASLKKQKK
ncbi:Transcriptional regulator [Candidatus Desulfarcum epimagneticum]|uniref:Transcriptional regulator n=1 Tax=uncultured Desulfobacteraceae bacterium TaxID=218296 RepID=A0A484HGA7_9BACT|nr:Transcriptional regulator [uncultured Desulfobacteraceae bacterium]